MRKREKEREREKTHRHRSRKQEKERKKFFLSFFSRRRSKKTNGVRIAARSDLLFFLPLSLVNFSLSLFFSALFSCSFISPSLLFYFEMAFFGSKVRLRQTNSSETAKRELNACSRVCACAKREKKKRRRRRKKKSHGVVNRRLSFYDKGPSFRVLYSLISPASPP